MKMYISALGHARNLKFNYYVHLLFINRLIPYRHTQVVLSTVGEVYSFKLGLFISALDHARIFILNSYVLLASIYTIYKFDSAWVI